MVSDDLVRASYEAFAGFHTGVYRDLGGLLAGGPGRRDVVEQGAVTARVSAAFEPFVDDALREVVAEASPRMVLDVGCGAGLQLATMLEAAPGAEGLGVDTDEAAAALVRRTLDGRGLGGRGRVLRTDVRDLPVETAGSFDLALVANVVYYVPAEERAALLTGIGALLAPGGTLLIVTTVATPQLFSRHFDLLLRAQEGDVSLPDAASLVTGLRRAGLLPASRGGSRPGPRWSPWQPPGPADPQAGPTSRATISAESITSGSPPPGWAEPPTRNSPGTGEAFAGRRNAARPPLLEVP